MIRKPSADKAPARHVYERSVHVVCAVNDFRVTLTGHTGPMSGSPRLVPAFKSRQVAAQRARLYPAASPAAKNQKVL